MFHQRSTLIKRLADIRCSVQIPSVTAQSDLDVFSICPTVTGDITISGTMTAATIPSSVQAIEGTVVVVNNTRIASIRAETLVNITGAGFSNLSSLTSLDMPALKLVGDPQTQDGGLFFWELPSLPKIYLPNLTELAWLDVWRSAPYPFHGLPVDFPSLENIWASALFDGVVSVEIPSLMTAGLGARFNQNALSFWDIKDFNYLSVPSLVSVAGLEVGDSASLTSLSFPKLTTINGPFTITNNSALLTLAGFPLLKTSGTINITGSFSTVSLPSLNGVFGDVYIRSSNGSFQCPIPQLMSDVVQGGYSFTCGNITSGFGGNTDNQSNHAGEIVGGIFLLILLAAIYGCCRHNGHRRATEHRRRDSPLDHANRVFDKVHHGIVRGSQRGVNRILNELSS